MRTLRTINELRNALSSTRSEGRRIGLVPTMGAFHAGHVSLMRQARDECEVVVVSLFVNPAQFNESSDLDAYPRDESQDFLTAQAAGVDYLFAPAVPEIYPDGFSTTVVVGGLTELLEGASRGRDHFDGVTTVVTKLLNIVQPGVAYFGQKDAQQAAVVRRLVTDLNLPVRIEVCPIIRDPDGLALSSRNVRLSPSERQQALVLSRTLAATQAALAGGEDDPELLRDRALALLAQAGVETEYFQLADPGTFAAVDRIDGPVLALVAARVGSTRLIDNQLLTTVGAVSTAAGSTTDWRL